MHKCKKSQAQQVHKYTNAQVYICVLVHLWTAIELMHIFVHLTCALVYFYTRAQVVQMLHLCTFCAFVLHVLHL